MAGVTPNDPNDADAGPNNLQNFPVLNSAVSGGVDLKVAGTLDGPPGVASFRVVLYDNAACNPSGNGEGQAIVASSSFNANGSGDVTFNFPPLPAVPTSHVITATATDPSGNTSEFSACRSITVDADSDNDLVDDIAESNCGSDFDNPAKIPERIDGAFAGVDDDGDTQVDENLPGGAANFDCDGDGYTGALENAVFTPTLRRDQDPCGLDGWPSNFFDDPPPPPQTVNEITIQDVLSFVAPTRHFGTSPPNPNYSPRWDLIPGGAGDFINIQDLTTLFAGVPGSPGYPPMLGGNTRAFGLTCPWP